MKTLPFPIKVLRTFCPDKLLESIEGDLLEKYAGDRRVYSEQTANLRLWWNVIRLFHPGILLRNKWPGSVFSLPLFANYLLTSRRHLAKDPFYTATNVLGLSLAFSFAFLSLLYIQQVRSYDQFHQHKNAVYRVAHRISNTTTGQLKDHSAVTAIPISRDLAQAIPTILDYTRIASAAATIKLDQEPYQEKIHFVDAGFFNMFDFPILEGRVDWTINTRSVMLAEHKAKQLFGSIDIVGESIHLDLGDSLITLLVAGVVDARIQQSSLPFDFLLPFQLYRVMTSEEYFDSYRMGLVENYIHVERNHDKQDLLASTHDVMGKFFDSSEIEVSYSLQPLSTLHFENEVIGNALYTDPDKILIFWILIALVLFIALVNYATLSVSQSLGRAKEMAMRTAIGATSNQVWKQMISESIMAVLIAILVSSIAAYFLLPFYNALLGESIRFLVSVRLFFYVLALFGSVAIFTGSIQATLFTRARRIRGLAIHLKMPKFNQRFNQLLLTFQFAICTILVLGAIYIRLQLHYIQNKDLGFSETLLVEISMDAPSEGDGLNQLFTTFQNASLRFPEITAVAGSMNNMHEPWTQLVFDQEDGSKEKIFFNQVTPSYLETMGIELVRGIGFRSDHSQANAAVLVNEALARHFGWEDPIGRQIPGKDFAGAHQIVGVVKDFHYSTLHETIKPLILALSDAPIRSGINGLSTYVWPPDLYKIYVRLAPGHLQESVSLLKTIWTEVSPHKPFVFHFVDEAIADRYFTETQWGRIANSATAMALIIAILGLLAAMRFSIQNRRKEIGIRKILGSSALEIMKLLSTRYLFTVLSGSLLALPIAWLLIMRWLETFSYQVMISPLVFAVVFLGLLVLTTLVLLFQLIEVIFHQPSRALEE